MPPQRVRIARSWSNGRLTHAARAFLAGFPESVALLPCHSAVEGMAQLGAGLAGVHQLTLLQLASSIAAPAMALTGTVPIGALGAEAVAARVVFRARASHELGYFAPVADLPGFGRALARTLAELRLAGIDGKKLSALPDLARLLERYSDELAACSLADATSVLQIATRGAIEPRSLLGLPLVVLDPPLESAAHQAFLLAVAQAAPSVLVLASAGNERALSLCLWDAESEDLDATAPETPLEHLRRNVFSPKPPPFEPTQESFEIFSAPGEGLESIEIARRILRLARQGVPFDEVAILLRSPDRYQPVIEEALRRARIPACYTRGSARPHPAGRAFLALLACAGERCSASRFAEYLSLGELPPEGWVAVSDWVGADDELLGYDPESEAPDPHEEPQPTPQFPTGWEKLLVDAAVIGGKDRWARRLRGLGRELALQRDALDRQDDPRRQHIERQLERLDQLERFALPLIDTLDALPASAQWSEWIASLSDLARRALRHPEPVLAVLAEFEPMGEVGPASLEEVAGVLSERLRFLRREPPARRWGRVFVASIEEARGREFKVVFLPGLAEGLFPRRAFEDPLLLDEHRRRLSPALPLRAGRVHEERLRLRLAIAAARDRLVASYPSMDVAEARPRVPSFYALELPRALEGSLPELASFEKLARESAPARLNWPAPAGASDAIDDAEYDLASLATALKAQRGGRYLVDANPHLARSLRGRYARWEPAWKRVDGLITRHPAALAALQEHRLAARAWAPSSLEQFAICPYRFALHGIYKLRPREDAAPLEQMDPLTRGALFHETQFALFTRLRDDRLLPVTPERLGDALIQADAALDEVARRYQDDLAPAIPRVWRSEIEDLRADLRGWLQQVAQNDADWEPFLFEFGFGLESRPGRDPLSTPEEAVLAEGVRLRGSIDLIERHDTGLLRVTDHKTGKLPGVIPAITGGGRHLQPMLYGLAAEKLLGARVDRGRLFYATQRGEYKSIEILLSGRHRLFLEKVLGNIDGSIASGFLPPAPAEKTCAHCDYSAVCGPYEEERFARRKDRRDERLEPLTEIRGFQ